MSSLDHDVFTGNNGDAIVDADVIEAVKENIQPLQKGRRATALSAIFSTPYTQRETMLSRKRAQFKLQVVQAMEDDEETTEPLDVYSRFVAWTLESYPQGQSSESGLLELLEEATRRLKARESCKQDPRYLKLWTLYASYVEKPAVIYAYLLVNEIGTNFSQFYEAYTLVLERDGRRKEADDIYNLGISRRVHNVEDLKKRYSEFQRRMLGASLPAPPSAPAQSRGPLKIGQRTVLGETVTKSHRAVPACTSGTSSTQPNSRLQVFFDPTGKDAERADGNEWAEIGTRTSTTKENRPDVHKMGSGPLPKSKSRGGQRIAGTSNGRITHTSAFVPFRDEDDTSILPASLRTISASQSESIMPATPRTTFSPFRDDAVQETPLGTINPLSSPMSLRPRHRSGDVISEAEALRKDPFKNYDVPPTDC